MSATLDADVCVTRGAFALAARFAAPLDAITVVFGPSGAGKSMLLSALAGLAPLDAGRIALADRVLDDVDAGVRTPAHQRGVGLVFQDVRLFPHLTVRGNLDYAARRAPTARLGFDDAVAHFELAALLDRAVRNLSGGEKNRVALARAFLSAPDLLLLDEPFAALDGVRRAAFLDTLRTLHAQFQLPMIVVTHQIDDAAFLADHIVALQGGQVVAAGPIAVASAEPAFQTLLNTHDVGAAVPAAALASAGGRRSGALWLRADHVLLAAQEPRGLSARNIWEGRIGGVEVETSGARLVTIATDAGPLLARVTAQAVDELGLAPGVRAWAIVKAHAV